MSRENFRNLGTATPSRYIGSGKSVRETAE